MNPIANLDIRLTRGGGTPTVGDAWLNQFHGGPEVLLGWLETQLGFRREALHKSNRITEFAGILETVPDGSFAQSLDTDRWATAADLLARRDELRLAGWDEPDNESFPRLVRDLARVAAARTCVFPDEASRIRNVLEALSSGQCLPPHQCVLHDPVDLWPVMWRRLLDRLTTVGPAPSISLAASGSALRTAQDTVRGSEPNTINQDESFRYVATRSEFAACEFIAAALAASPKMLPRTAIYCENDALALHLDGCLKRLGAPTMGAALASNAHPVLQILPLVLALCWDPVDPAALLDFLMLPVNPLQRRVAERLIAGLTKQPGLGSASWDEAVADLCSLEEDPNGKVKETLADWLFGQRGARGAPIDSKIIRSRCNFVARWAMGRAKIIAGRADCQDDLITALGVASGQAAMLGDLVESQGPTITEPQLMRLYHEVIADGLPISPLPSTSAGPTRVRSLADLDGSYARLIWLGLATGDASRSRWSAAELAGLRDCGVDLDDGSRSLTAMRAAESRGFASIKNSLLAVMVPRDLAERWHPIWLAVRRTLQNCEEPPCLEDLLSLGDTTSLTPFTVETAEYPVEPPHAERPLWTVPSSLLRDRETVSASELQDRLACPLKWVLNYQAKLRPSPIARLPKSFQLMGTFCHSILERAFQKRDSLPSVDEAIVLVGQLFDERLPLDGAPLAQPHQMAERRQLRAQLISATRVLVNALASGGYRITGIEVEISAEAFGKELNGRIDCVAEHHDGHEAVIDFKYAGKKYRDLLADGRAVQLATYAYSRSQLETAKGRFPAIAYLVLADGRLLTPSGSPLQCDGNHHIVNGPAVRDVWRQFTDAIDGAGSWLAGAEPVPARPLQAANTWPIGVELVLDAKLPKDKQQEPCRYCDFQHLCGLSPLT